MELKDKVKEGRLKVKKKKYVLKKVAYSGLAAGVVLTTVVPNVVLAESEIDEVRNLNEGTGKSVYTENEIKQSDDYKVPMIKGYDLEGEELTRISNKRNLYAPGSDLHLKFDFENLENVAELGILEDGELIYKTDKREDMTDIILSKYLTDVTDNKSKVPDLPVEYKVQWRDTKGKIHTATLEGVLKDKRLVYDAYVSLVRFDLDAAYVDTKVYSSLDKLPYYKLSSTGIISLRTTNTTDSISKVDVSINGKYFRSMYRGSGINYFLDVLTSSLEESSNGIYRFQAVTTTTSGDTRISTRDFKIVKNDPTFDFELKSTDGVVSGHKAYIGKASNGYSVHFNITERDIPVELEFVELWKNGTKVKSASLVKNNGVWESDDLEVGSGTYEVRVVSDTGWNTKIGQIEVEEDSTAPAIEDEFRPEATKDGKDWVVGTVDVPFTARDENGLRSVVVKANGREVYKKDVTKLAADVREFTDTVSKSSYAPDADGKVKLEYVVIDKFGNESTKVREFYVTNVRPSIVSVEEATSGVHKTIFGQDMFASGDIMLRVRTKGATSMMFTNSKTGTSTTVETLSTLVSLKGFDRIKVMNQLGITSEEYKLLKLYKELQGTFIVDDSRPTGVFKGLDLPSGVEWFASKPNNVSLVAADDKALKSVKIKVNGLTLVNEEVAREGVEYLTSKEYSIDMNLVRVSADGKVKFEVEIEDMLGKTTITKEIKVDTNGFDLSNYKLTADKPYKSYNSGVYFKEAPSEYTQSGVHNLSGVKSYRVSKTVGDLGTAAWKPYNDKVVFSEDVQWVQFEDTLSRVSEPLNIAQYLDKGGLTNITASKVFVDSEAPQVTFENKSTITELDGKKWVAGLPKIDVNLKDNLHLAGYEVYFNGNKVVDKKNYLSNVAEGTLKEDIGEELKKYLARTNETKVEVKVVGYDKAGNETTKVEEYNVDIGKVESSYDVIGGGINDTANKKFHSTEPYKIRLKNVKSVSGVAKVKFYGTDGSVIKEVPYVEGQELEVPVGTVGYMLENRLGVDSDKVELFGGSRLVVDTQAPTITENVADDKYTKDGQDWYTKEPTVTVRGVDEENLSEFKIISPKGEVVAKQYGLEKDTGVINVDFSGLEAFKGRKISYGGQVYGSDDANAYNFLYVARDKAGHETVKASTYYVDKELPKVEGSVTTTPTVFGNDLFYKDEFRAKINVSALAGVKSVTLGGKPLDTSVDFVRTEEFEDEDVEVTNNLGVKTTRKLYDILGIKGKTVHIDKTRPGLKYQTNGKDAYKDAQGRTWFSEMKNFTLFMADDKAIGNYVVKVNGVILAEKVIDGNKTQLEEVIDFSNVQVAGDGTYNIETIVVDKAGRETKSSQVVYIDHIKPDIKGIVLDNTKVTTYKDFGYYVKGSELKVLEYKLQTPLTGGKLYKNGNLIDPVASAYSDSGNSTYVYEDNLGRKSKEYKFAELVGLPKVDKEVFVYDVKAPEGVVKNVVDSSGTKEVKVYEANGISWVGKLSHLGIDVKDDKGLHKVTVQVDGKEVYSKVVDGKLQHSDVVDLEKTLGKKLEDGRHTVVYKIEDMAGHVTESSKVWYLDTKAPEVKGFDFVQEGYKEGSTLTTNFDKYGFFFQSGTQVRVLVEDSGESSGLDEVEVTLRSAAGGKEEVKKAKVVNGVAVVDVPIDFKGWVLGKVRDNIGNESDVRGADGVITESKNWHVSTSKVDITLPETQYRTTGGLPLYNGGVNLSGAFSQSVAGVRSIMWTVNGSNAGNDWSKGSMDKNLVTSGTSGTSVSGDNQEHSVVLGVTDNAGHLSEANAKFAIDTTAPEISVSYDNNSANGKYYSSGRTATITIVEKNFNPNDVRLKGTNAALSWSSNGDTHTATISFNEDGDYNWGIDYTDMAGNAGKGYESGDFTVDRTAPVVEVSWDNNDAKNGNYYKASRTATVTVRERNFDAARFNVSGGSLSGWISSGDVHTARVTFGDGEHKLTVSGTDLAGNQSNTYDSGNFIVDTVNPELGISGVTDGASYDGDVLPVVTFSDKYINQSSVRVTLRGQRNGTIEMKGSIVDGKFYVENLPKEAKYDDYYTLTAHVEDMAGNSVEKTISYYVNRFGATFKFGSGDNVVKYYKEVTEDIELTVTSVTPLDIDKFEYTVQLDGQVREVKKPRVVESRDAKGNYIYRVIFDKDNFKENGVWGISVKTVDKFGKVSDSGSVKMNFVVDNIKPNIVFVGAEDNEFIESTRHKVTIKISDNVRVRDVKYWINGVEHQFTDEDIKRGYLDLFLDGSNEPYTIKVVATDLAGNKVESSVKNFYVSTNSFLKFKASVWYKVVLGFSGVMGAIITFIVGRWLFLTARRRRAEERALDEAIEKDGTEQ